MSDPVKDKVKQQVEFYFSDSNLPRDKFLLDQVTSDADGFVDIALLCTFSRMQALLKSSVGDPGKVSDQSIAGVAAALASSESLLLSDDKRRVRRREALAKPVEELSLEVDERSLYASPFPFDATLDALVAFFSQHGTVNCVRMRRHLVSKDFKGSVFVEFASREEAERVRGLALVHEGAPLTLKPKAEYLQEKEEQRAARLAAPEAVAAAPPPPPPPPRRAQQVKRLREEDDGEGEGGGEGEEGAGGEKEAPAAAAEGSAPGEESALPAAVDYTPGCIVHFDFGAEAALGEAVTFALVKDSFGGKEAGLRYVEYETGGRQGHARFATPEAAAAVLAAAGDSGKTMIAGYEAAVRVVEGDEEKAYVTKMAAQRAERERQQGDGGGRFKG